MLRSGEITLTDESVNNPASDSQPDLNAVRNRVLMAIHQAGVEKAGWAPSRMLDETGNR